MPSRINVGYSFTPATVTRIEQLIQYYELNRTALLEKLVKDEYEELLNRYHTPPASIEEMYTAGMAALAAMYEREAQANPYASQEQYISDSTTEEQEFAGSFPQVSS